MCNRFALHTPVSRLQDAFGFSETPEERERFNIAPTQRVLTVRLGRERVPEAVLMRWGLDVAWEHGPLINARAESAAERPAFRDAFLHRRALVLADGFFEWRPEGGGKQPYFLTLSSGEPFGIGALYEPATRDDEPAACVILTVEANALVASIHDRMPLIVPADARAAWLDPLTSLEELTDLCVPFPPERMAIRAVDRAVNDVRKEGPELLHAPRQGALF